MTAAAAPYLTWLHTAAVGAEQTAGQARAAASAYETAFAMTVPPPVIAVNRSQLTALVATNLLGQNTPAIAATEIHYAEMWAQDAVAMYTYSDSAATAAVLKPFEPAPNTANPAAAVGHAVIASAVGHPPLVDAQLTAVPSALHSLTSPTAVSSASQPALLAALPPGLSADPALGSAFLSLAINLFDSLIVDSVGTFGIDTVGTFAIDGAGAAIGELEAIDLPLIGLAGWSSPIAAGLGQAVTLSGLSVPAAWTAAVPSAAQLATALTAAGTAAGPTFAALPFAPMASAGLAGAATGAAGQAGRGGSSTARRAKQKCAEVPKAPPKTMPKPAPKGPITGISGKLRRLAALRDVGILTQEKFTEKKRRLLDQHGST